MESDQIKKILVPMLAISGVVLLVVLILTSSGSFEQEPSQKQQNVVSGLTPASTTPLNVPADSGMTADLPKLDAPEWEPVGKDGLKKWDVLVGSGLEVQVTNEVEFHYTGWLTNGNVFDSSWKGGKPISFQIRGLIPGWIQGIPGMRVGGIRRLYVPSHLGYGAQDKGTIPPNSNLIFEIKVMRIVN